jgi:two-component system chemotaxis response regulator CheB
VITGLPADIPPTVIVQHMPATFTGHFADRLNSLCRFTVKEAQEGDELRSGLALLAPGDFHMKIIKTSSGKWCVSLNKDPLLHGVRPAIDITMRSVAELAGGRSVGVILTGMGKDGAQGLLEMKKAGAKTIAQDAKTSVVYGMPRAAFECGAVQQVLPLKEIADAITVHLNQRSRKV